MRKKLHFFFNNINKKSQILHIFYYISIIFTIIASIYTILNNKKYSLSTNSFNSSDLINFNTGWYDKDHTPISLSCFLENKNVKPYKEYIFYHNTDSTIKAGDTLCFRGLSTDISVYIGDKLVLSTEYKTNFLTCKSPGSVWYFYKIKQSDLNKKFKLKIKTCYNDSACYIDLMYVGEKSTYIFSYIKQNMLSILLTILIAFTGIMFIVIDLYINYMQKINRHTLFNVGLFSILISFWSLISTHILDFIPNTSQSNQLLSCTFLYLIPTAIVIFIDDYYKNDKTKLVTFNIIFNTLLYIISWTLHLTRIQDFHESLILSHTVIIVSTLLTIIQFILYRKSSKKETFSKKNSLNIHISISNIIFALILLCFLGNIYMFYSNSNVNTGSFTQLASLLIIIYLGILSFKNLYNLDKQITHNKFVRELAYTDGLTGLKNRTAFIEKIELLENQKNNYNSIGIVTFDINNLKSTNDTYGHNIGDELIRSAANVIKNTFDDECTAYRIGGDEFIVIIESSNAETLYKTYSMQLNVNIQNFNNFFNKSYKLSIAYGCAFYRQNQNIPLRDILNISDKEMYTNKTNQKKSS